MENYIIANCTDVGKTRSVNEDSMATFDTPDNGRVVVVCDGMGGQNAGDVASQIAVSVIQDILTDNAFATPEEAITSSVIAANKAILNRAAKDPSLMGMGSTCVMAIIKDGKLYYGSVGDSRIYYIANGLIRQITKDQSYVQTLVDAGEITQEQAEHHANKNEITNALGVETMTPPVISQVPITPEPGSVCLLCSDGLTGMVSNNTIMTTVMRKDKSLKERAEMLVAQANIAGGHDNITVQLIEWSANGKAACGRSATAYRQKKNNAIYYIAALLLLMVACGGIGYWYLHTQKPVSHPVQEAVVQKKKVKKGAESPTTRTVVKEVITEKTVKKSAKKTDKKDNNNIFNKVNRKEANNKAQKQTGKEIVGKSGNTDVPKSEAQIKKGDFSTEKTY